MFHQFNLRKAQGGRLLIAAAKPPTQLPWHLPDLQSRLSWGSVHALQQLDDDALQQALQLRAQSLGLDLPMEVAKFIVQRCERKLISLFALLQQLDQQSLVQQRKITVPFVKQLLNL